MAEEVDAVGAKRPRQDDGESSAAVLDRQTTIQFHNENGEAEFAPLSVPSGATPGQLLALVRTLIKDRRENGVEDEEEDDDDEERPVSCRDHMLDGCKCTLITGPLYSPCSCTCT